LVTLSPLTSLLLLEVVAVVILVVVEGEVVERVGIVN
jgi:hypothetical protein